MAINASGLEIANMRAWQIAHHRRAEWPEARLRDELAQSAASAWRRHHIRDARVPRIPV